VHALDLEREVAQPIENPVKVGKVDHLRDDNRLFQSGSEVSSSSLDAKLSPAPRAR
jgi:hypothetical protein